MIYKYLCDSPYGPLPVTGRCHTSLKGVFFLLNGKQEELPCFYCNSLTTHKDSCFRFFNNPSIDGKYEFKNLVLVCSNCSDREAKRFHEFSQFFNDEMYI